MKNYIFYTLSGFTQDENQNTIENCQILDWQNGEDAKEAFKNFKKENPNVNFGDICCQELASKKVYYY